MRLNITGPSVMADAHPMIPLAILMPITVAVRVSHGWFEVLLLDIPFFVIATVCVSMFYVASQREIGAGLWQRVKHLPFVMALGIGLSVNQARAVVEALVGYETGFARTPKLGANSRDDAAARRRYKVAVSFQPLVELAFAAYFTFAVLWVLERGAYYSLPFLLLFQAGFGYVALSSLLEGLRDLRARFVPVPQTADAE